MVLFVRHSRVVRSRAQYETAVKSWERALSAPSTGERGPDPFSFLRVWGFFGGVSASPAALWKDLLGSKGLHESCEAGTGCYSERTLHNPAKFRQIGKWKKQGRVVTKKKKAHRSRWKQCRARADPPWSKVG